MVRFLERGYIIYEQVDNHDRVYQIFIGTREQAEKECRNLEGLYLSSDTFWVGTSVPIYTTKDTSIGACS